MSQSSDNSEHYEVKLGSYKVVGWLGVVFFTLCSAGAVWSRQYRPIAVFGFFVALSIYTILAAGEYCFNQEDVTHQTVLGTFRYRIRWEEIKSIEIGAADGTIVFHGEDKRFVIAPLSAWSGPQKLDAYKLFAQKVSDLGIEPYTSRVAAYKIHKNVKVYPNSTSTRQPG